MNHRMRDALLRHAQGTTWSAEQGIAEEEALKQGLETKSKEFVEKGAKVYAGEEERFSNRR